MNQWFDERTLSAYIDCELDAVTMRQVEVFLERDEDARRYVLGAIKSTALLRATMNQTLHEEVPDRLVTALNPWQRNNARQKPALHHLLRIAAALVLVLIGFGAGTLLNGSGRNRFPDLAAPLPNDLNQVVDETLEYNLSGTSRQWRAPRASLTITVTPIRTYRDKKGLYYREYRLEVTSRADRRRVNGLAYRSLDGKWKTKALFFNEEEKSI